jgi:hypothetical protein
MAEVLGLLNATARETALDPAVVDEVTAHVHATQPTRNAATLEQEFVRLRADAVASVDVDELVGQIKSALGRGDWSKMGRRAELRALTRMAARLDAESVQLLLTALSQENQPDRVEDLCVVLGDAFWQVDDAPLTVALRAIARHELGAGRRLRPRGWRSCFRSRGCSGRNRSIRCSAGAST